MARFLRLSPRYLSDAKALAPDHSRDLARRLARTLLALEDADELPEHGDVAMLLPPTEEGRQVQVFAYGRQVPGRDLVIWYRVTESEVRLEALTRGF